ncbi:hypothetical protein KUV89_10095 [Marinobacter hydrocarbonoclasticus]|nr:hypothetical protein [Marinobacter nauticus]
MIQTTIDITIKTTMDDTIRRALTQLTESGKTPTLAQLKARLGPKSHPMPVLIQALQQWKVAPQPLAEAPKAAAQVVSDEPTPAQLQAQIDELRQQVAQLQAELAALKPR